MSTSTDHTAEHASSGHGIGHHVPLRVLVATLAVLLVLTFVTVAVTWFELGALSLWIAMLIATVKAVLVALYFMHLRYDKPFNAVILIAALLFVLLFIGLTLIDVKQYEPDVQAYREKNPEGYAPDLASPGP